MKLPREFYRLPVRFDVARMQQEVAALPASAWHGHPSGFPGNSSVRLISAGGGENDDVSGEMSPTPHLLVSPYLRQVLASFGVVWSRSRLMRLGPHSNVPEHCDINHHWYHRVRVHIPVTTFTEVRFHCGTKSVHMAEGEAWIFDNWRPHRVDNPTNHDRIHLVADTAGGAAFWHGVSRSVDGEGPGAVPLIPFQPGYNPLPLTERYNFTLIMHPSEVEGLVRDLSADLELIGSEKTTLHQFRLLLDNFCREWRQLWSLHGESPSGWGAFTEVRDAVRTQAKILGASIQTRSNSVPASQVLLARVVAHLVNLPSQSPTARDMEYDVKPMRRVEVTAQAKPSASNAAFRQPVFIVAAPRSGSTLLFETLACGAGFWTVGGEAHWLIEKIPELQVGAPGVDSNRLTAAQYSEALGDRIKTRILAKLCNATGDVWTGDGAFRLLEKTPKNALRIPFFDQVFPDAKFIFLWRDPHENISSIIEAWRSGGWVTYPQLEGWEGPWSLLLPPGWPALRGRSLEEVAAFQWDCTNRIILEDLGKLPRERWMALNYSELLSQPAATVQGLCSFAGIEFDGALRDRVSQALPLSKFTQTLPAAGKWERNGAAIARVLPAVGPTWRLLRALSTTAPV